MAISFSILFTYLDKTIDLSILLFTVKNVFIFLRWLIRRNTKGITWYSIPSWRRIAKIYRHFQTNWIWVSASIRIIHPKKLLHKNIITLSNLIVTYVLLIRLKFLFCNITVIFIFNLTAANKFKLKIYFGKLFIFNTYH